MIGEESPGWKNRHIKNIPPQDYAGKDESCIYRKQTCLTEMGMVPRPCLTRVINKWHGFLSKSSQHDLSVFSHMVTHKKWERRQTQDLLGTVVQEDLKEHPFRFLACERYLETRNWKVTDQSWNNSQFCGAALQYREDHTGPQSSVFGLSKAFGSHSTWSVHQYHMAMMLRPKIIPGHGRSPVTASRKMWKASSRGV